MTHTSGNKPLPAKPAHATVYRLPTLHTDNTMDEPLPISISVSGPTLASLLLRLSSSPSDCSGLLFGHLSSLATPSLPDDDDASYKDPSPSLSLSITSLLSFPSPSSFFDPIGRLRLPLLSRLLSSLPDGLLPLGWFSARRNSPLRPSMRERAVTNALLGFLQSRNSAPPPAVVLILLTSSASANLAVHTHDHRAFELRRPGGALELRTVRVTNVGVGFRGQYGSFAPESGFPWVPCGVEGGRVERGEQDAVDGLAAGFPVARLRKMAGKGAAGYAGELEELYGKMLAKLAELAGRVEESSAKVFEQESRNMKLRSRIAGLE